MELLVVVPVAIVVALLTLVLCDLVGSIARVKGRSYWAFFAFTLLLWFPALLTALLLPAKGVLAEARPPRLLERSFGILAAVLGTLAAAAGLTAAVAFAP